MITIKISEREGNAFYIIGIVKDLMRKQNKSDDEIKRMIADMMSGDYDHLLGVVKNEFPNDINIIEDA